MRAWRWRWPCRASIDRCRRAELSDGTLRYLCLLAALLSPRPPTFLVLNEPETTCTPISCRRSRT